MSAVPFDAESLAVTGIPAPLVEGVMVKNIGAANFSVSDNGHLVYASTSDRGTERKTLVWVDRDGREEPVSARARDYHHPRISPDGARVALAAYDEERDIWAWDFAAETLTRVTFYPGADLGGDWTPDGQRIIFSSNRDGPLDLFWTAANGTGTSERLSKSDAPQMWVNAVTPDGTRMVAYATVPGRQGDLVVVTLDGDPTADTLLSTEFDERNAALSPDGKWVAFESNGSGAPQVLVRPFPDVEARQWQISNEGGRSPVWSTDGRELFYRQGNRLMAVTTQTDPTFASGTPAVLFEANYYTDSILRPYDVAPDGRFLMLKPTSSAEEGDLPLQLTVVLNWFEELKRLVPVN